jgi:hypothetical protein
MDFSEFDKFANLEPSLEDVLNEVSINTTELVKLKEIVLNQANMLSDLKDIIISLESKTLKNSIKSNYIPQPEPPLKKVKFEKPEIKKCKKLDSKNIDFYSFAVLAKKHKLSQDDAETIEVLANGCASLFLKQKSPQNCFVSNIYFQWLSSIDCVMINESFINATCELLKSLGMMKSSLPTRKVWDTILQFHLDNKIGDKQRNFNFYVFFDKIDESIDIMLGCYMEQIHFLDSIRNYIFEMDEDNHFINGTISEWHFTYLCLCVLEGSPIIHTWASITLLALISTHERIPDSIFDNEIICSKLASKISQSKYYVNINGLLKILFKLHKFRNWVNFFQIYDNVSRMSRAIPQLTKSKENQKVMKFKLELGKIKKGDF